MSTGQRIYAGGKCMEGMGTKKKYTWTVDDPLLAPLLFELRHPHPVLIVEQIFHKPKP
jgi:hypothetical protein